MIGIEFDARALMEAPAHLLRRAVRLLEEQMAERPAKARLNVLEARKKVLAEEIARREGRRTR